MKGYLFGLGAMLVGAGLMFVLMHGEVSAEGEADYDFICKMQKLVRPGEYELTVFTRAMWKCKKGKTTCYFFSRGHGDPEGPRSLSCINTGIFK